MSFDAMMEELKQEYIQSLPEKIQNIEEHIGKKCQQSLIEDFHKLKGTGSTYGLPEVSTLAESIESICLNSDSEHSVQVALQAVPILKDIHQYRLKDQLFPVQSDARFQQINKASAA